jgi:hypothetical protein
MYPDSTLLVSNPEFKMAAEKNVCQQINAAVSNLIYTNIRESRGQCFGISEN